MGVFEDLTNCGRHARNLLTAEHVDRPGAGSKDGHDED
jgi:hypothetical protein